MAPEKPEKRKILFFAANPRDTDYLNLNDEIEGIRSKLAQAKHGDSFEFKECLVLTPKKMQTTLLQEEPQIQ